MVDKAYTIKNRNAKMTKACYKVQSHYRWCLTGMLMQNTLDDLASTAGTHPASSRSTACEKVEMHWLHDLLPHKLPCARTLRKCYDENTQ
jgi:hypothetical protein